MEFSIGANYSRRDVPAACLRRLGRDHAAVVDSSGIRCLIKSVRRLDGASRRILERFL